MNATARPEEVAEPTSGDVTLLVHRSVVSTKHKGHVARIEQAIYPEQGSGCGIIKRVFYAHPVHA